MINQSHYDLPTIVPSSFLKLTELLYNDISFAFIDGYKYL